MGVYIVISKNTKVTVGVFRAEENAQHYLDRMLPEDQASYEIKYEED